MTSKSAKFVVDSSGKFVVVAGLADGLYSIEVTGEGRIIIKPSAGGDEKPLDIKDGKTSDKSLLLLLATGEYNEVEFVKMGDAFYQVMAS